MTQHLCAPLPTAQEMRRWDSAALAYGLPECLLMENAAREAFFVLQQEYGALDNTPILFFMGSGNNGGDAACLARHTLDAGAHPLVLHTKPLSHYKGVTKQHITMAKKCGVPFLHMGKKKISDLPGKEHWNKPHILVDGLLGTGFEGALRPEYQEYIAHINSHKEHAYILALDIPSGCEALTGLPHASSPVAVQAHATVAFAAAKPGLILPQAAPYVGKLFVRSIGIPRPVQKEIPPSFRLLQKQRIGALLQGEKAHSHKNTWGHVLVMGGSIQEADLSGAAHLTALAALRTGAGLVTAAAPKSVCSSIKNSCPNIMTLSLTPPQSDPLHWPKALPRTLADKLSQVHAIALGPGMGTRQDSQLFLQALLQYPERPRAILDADALTLIAASSALQALVRHDDILTPHPGEAGRFLQCSSKEIQAQRFDAIKQLAQKIPCVWLLKGAGTLVCQQESPIYILPHDTLALAIAGSGDVLTGCMAALAARLSQEPSLHIALLGAAVHEQCGAMAQKLYPQRGHMASELAHLLPQALQHLHDAAHSTLQGEVYSLDHTL